MLAAKTALGIRVDALGESDGVTIGFEGREKVELRLKQLETGVSAKATGSAVKTKPQQEKYNKPNNTSAHTTRHTQTHSLPPSSSSLPSSLTIVISIISLQSFRNEYLSSTRILTETSQLSPLHSTPLSFSHSYTSLTFARSLARVSILQSDLQSRRGHDDARCAVRVSGG